LSAVAATRACSRWGCGAAAMLAGLLSVIVLREAPRPYFEQLLSLSVKRLIANPWAARHLADFTVRV